MCFCPEFGEIEVFASGARLVACKDAGVRLRRLSIKLDREGEDGDKDVGV